MTATAKKIFKYLMLGILVFIFIAAFTNVPVNVDVEDEFVFKKYDLHSNMGRKLKYEDQILLIKKIQGNIFKMAPLGDGIPEYKTREPADLFRHGKGLCYDRSRSIEKALKYVGLESRHVYILYKDDKKFLGALLTYGHASHAVTEVNTLKGWMLVDSNQPWIAVTNTGLPVSADQVFKRYLEFEDMPDYLKNSWWAIRGLYSRKGTLYNRGVPFPELNWAVFFDWFFLEYLKQ